MKNKVCAKCRGRFHLSRILIIGENKYECYPCHHSHRVKCWSCASVILLSGAHCSCHECQALYFEGTWCHRCQKQCGMSLCCSCRVQDDLNIQLEQYLEQKFPQLPLDLVQALAQQLRATDTVQ